jgi:hypothetical protein
MNKTKLLVIDTQKREARSFEGNYECGFAHLPNPEAEDDEGNFTANQLTHQLNEFREAADERRYRKDEEAKARKIANARLMEKHNEYAYWHNHFFDKQ